MCGIAGIYGLERIERADEAISSMTDRLSHRGPDAQGIYSGKNVRLGHRRLSIIDLSESANQPFTDPTGRYTLVYNGELYNYQSLRDQLTDFSFQTNSDSEVVLAALIKWGVGALQLFNGMFSLAFWDNESEKLILVRDRLGIKPLYYSWQDQTLVFASELRSILSSGLVPRKLNERGLVDYLRYQTVHGPDTIIDNVQILPAGSYLTAGDGEYEVKPYWKPWQKLHLDQDPIKIQKEVRDKLTSAVEKRLVADVPFGAFLSGGIDSSLIVGIISERLGKTIDTFNVSFDESEYSEAVYAQSIAKKFGTKHHEIRLKPDEFLKEVPDALKAMDHPSGDGPNTWVVSKETKRQGISMALSGLGGDELFAGYDVFTRIPYVADRHWILSFPKGLRSLVGDILNVAKPGFPSAKTREILTADYFDLQHLYPIFRKVLLDDNVSRLLGRTSLPTNKVFELVEELEQYYEFGNIPTLSRISIAEMSSYMQNVLLRDTDQMSMAHALEVRVPFLDHELVEYATHIPDHVKYPSSPKKLLVESFADLLPDDIVHRKKMGFILPWEQWLRTDLRPMAKEHLSWLGETTYFDESELDRLWNSFLNNDPKVTWSRVWPMITLAHWMRENNIE